MRDDRPAMERAIEVTLDPRRRWAEVSPYRARGLLVSVDARPLWAPRRKVWSVSHKHGVDVIALAERLGYQVTVHADPKPEPRRPSSPSSEDAPEAEAGLW